MKRNGMGTVIAVVAVLGVTALAPLAAGADSLQQQKNTWRNLAVVGGVAAVYGLSRHDAGTALLGIAGAAYAEGQADRDQRIENGCGYYGDDRGYGLYYRDGRGDRDDRGRGDYHDYDHGRR